MPKEEKVIFSTWSEGNTTGSDAELYPIQEIAADSSHNYIRNILKDPWLHADQFVW